MKKYRQHILFSLYMTVLFLPLFELGARIIGYRPYQQVPFSISSNPEFCLIPHANQGFALRPGTFHITVNEGLTFSATHNDDSFRITSFTPDSVEKPEIWILGCSYTYGFGVDDSLTYPFLLQHKMPDFNVSNLAVPGFGNLQSLIQIKQAVNVGHIPKTIIINYADFHDDRNVLSPTYRRDLYMGFLRSNDQARELMTEGRIPYFEQEDEQYKIKRENWTTVHKPWKGSEDWASINFFQVIAGQIAMIGVDKRQATLEIFRQIQSICKENQIRLIVTGLTDQPTTHEMLNNLKEMELETLDISLNLQDSTYNHLPYDSHPNAKAHAHFADGVYGYLR